MNAILYHAYNSTKIPLTGCIIDAFEYFIKIYEYNKDIKLLLLKTTSNAANEMISIFKNRYDLSDVKGFEENILVIDFKYLLKNIFDKLLVIDLITISKTRGLVRAKEIIVISNINKSLEDIDNYRYSSELYNVKYYGEMPFHYKDSNYKMKFLFDKFKDLKKVEEGIYVNIPDYNKIDSLDKYALVESLNLPQKPLIFKDGKHRNNLFEKFDTYLYYHINGWFDPHPRLIIECFFYGKEIIYINNLQIKDGSYYRYRDLLENGIGERELTKDDEIIQQFI